MLLKISYSFSNFLSLFLYFEYYLFLLNIVNEIHNGPGAPSICALIGKLIQGLEREIKS